jgi:dolichyl-phosphate-mannose--protein O-mannosyl transferase
MLLRINKKKAILVFYILLILFVSYFTYFRNYWYPNNLFWDENYYIASGYKYLNHVLFMEPHPPLGKLFIAWGEYIFHPNTTIDTSGFLSTDHITDIPTGFSFVGVRFFPVLFATFSSVLFFLILFSISKNSYLSFLFSSFYLFDNALIVHSRGAMLEGIQFFFILLAIYYFLRLLEKKIIRFFDYLCLGVLVGLSLSVKLNSSFLVLLFPFLYLYKHAFEFKKMKYFVEGFYTFLFFLIGVLVILISVYTIHIELGQRAMDGRYYAASNVYKQVLAKKQTSNFAYLPQMLWDNLSFIKQYEAGVPASDSNGSPFYTWPVGGKAINYRWDSSNGVTKYLYLQGNPLIWFSGLLGVVIGFFLLVRSYIFRKKTTDKRLLFIIAVFFLLYISYMLAMVPIHRVMYLYHYLIPLLLSLVLAFCCYIYIFREAIRKRDRRLVFFTLLYIACIVFSYSFFSPFTYYLPLIRSQFLLRDWFWFWGMKPV